MYLHKSVYLLLKMIKEQISYKMKIKVYIKLCSCLNMF